MLVETVKFLLSSENCKRNLRHNVSCNYPRADAKNVKRFLQPQPIFILSGIMVNPPVPRAVRISSSSKGPSALALRTSGILDDRFSESTVAACVARNAWFKTDLDKMMHEMEAEATEARAKVQGVVDKLSKEQLETREYPAEACDALEKTMEHFLGLHERLSGRHAEEKRLRGAASEEHARIRQEAKAEHDRLLHEARTEHEGLLKAATDRYRQELTEIEESHRTAISKMTSAMLQAKLANKELQGRADRVKILEVERTTAEGEKAEVIRAIEQTFGLNSDQLAAPASWPYVAIGWINTHKKAVRSARDAAMIGAWPLIKQLTKPFEEVLEVPAPDEDLDWAQWTDNAVKALQDLDLGAAKFSANAAEAKDETIGKLKLRIESMNLEMAKDYETAEACLVKRLADKDAVITALHRGLTRFAEMVGEDPPPPLDLV